MNVQTQMARSEYDALTDRVNYSTLKILGLKSPAHYLHALAHGGPDSSPRKLGRAVHVAALEPEKFAAEFIEYEERRAGRFWEQFKVMHADREILSSKEMAAARRVAAAVRSHPIAAPYLAKGVAEATILWDYTVPTLGGVEGFTQPLKGRVDFVSAAEGGCLVDLKSTRSSAPGPFGADAARYQYHVQAAMYVDGYEAATGKRLPYLLIAVESEGPCVSQVYRIPEDLIELGRETYRDWLGRLNYCRRENVWPGYADAPIDLALPRWATPSEEEVPWGDDLDIPAAAGVDQ